MSLNYLIIFFLFIFCSINSTMSMENSPQDLEVESESKEESKSPIIKLELINPQDSVLEFVPSFNGEPQSPRRILSPLQFSGHSSIFWLSKDLNLERNPLHGNENKHESGRESEENILIPIQFKLSCSAPYLTLWRVNSNSTTEMHSRHQHKEKTSYISYSVHFLSRPHEHILSPDKNNKHMYNLTVLTVHGFGPEFRKGFIDCVDRANEQVRTRLYIFQRFDVKDSTFDDSNDATLYTNDLKSVIPCKVHDPEMKPKLEINTNYKWSKIWTDVTDKFVYDWKTGFWPKNSHFYGHVYRCVINDKFLTYHFKPPQQTTTRRIEPRILSGEIKQNTTIDVNKILSTKIERIKFQGQEYLQFVCKIDEGYLNVRNSAALKSVHLSSCISPDYCIPNDINDSRFTVNCTEAMQEECELRLPLPLETKREKESAFDLQGKLTCFIDVNNEIQFTSQIFFTGISGKIYILSDMITPPQEIFYMKINNTVDSSNKINVSCTALKFFTSPPIIISIDYKNGTLQYLKGEKKVKSRRNFHQEEAHIPVELSPDILKVTCQAPPLNSPVWIKLSMDWPQEFVFPSTTEKSTVSQETSLPQLTTVSPMNTSKIEGLNPAMGEPSINSTYDSWNEIFTEYSKSTSRITEATTIASTEEKQETIMATTAPSSIEFHNGENISQKTLIISCVLIAVLLLTMIVVACIYYHCIVEWICCPRRGIKAFGEKSAAYEMKPIVSFKMKLDLPPRYKLSSNRISLDADNLIWKGQLSNAYQGYLKKGKKGEMQVAIETNKATTDAGQIGLLLNDIRMRVLAGDEHLNIAGILGACLNRLGGKIYIVSDAANSTTLRDTLTNKNNEGEITHKILKMPPQQSLHTLLTSCNGIAEGMQFLHDKNIIHGNLAAEHILVFPENSVKITGFAHAHQLEGDSKHLVQRRKWANEWKTSGWKWMPMESLRFYEFSKKSDIWTFGVVMWELFSLGALPFTSNDDEGCEYSTFSVEFILQLEAGMRLGHPQMASMETYKKMTECWSRFAKDRPTFTELCEYFKDILSQRTKKHSTISLRQSQIQIQNSGSG